MPTLQKGQGYWLGKKNPECSKRMMGENNPCYGRKGQKHPMYGTKRPDTSKQNKERKGESNPNYGKEHIGLNKGENNPMFGKPTAKKKWGYYKGIFMRSSWEIKVAQLLDEANVKWKYEIKRFTLKNLTYCPDFYLPKYNLWVEVKGWMTAKCKKRIKQFRELYLEENLLVIDTFLYQKYCRGE